MFSKLGALARTDATCKSEESDLNNSQPGKKIGNKDLQLFERWERENNSAKIMGQLLMGFKAHYPSGPYLMIMNMGLLVWACYVQTIAKAPTVTLSREEFFCFIAKA